jgi:hypothetical protein
MGMGNTKKLQEMIEVILDGEPIDDVVGASLLMLFNLICELSQEERPAEYISSMRSSTFDEFNNPYDKTIH